MSDLILDLIKQRATGIRKGRLFSASCMPESIIYSTELGNFSDFEVDVIGVENHANGDTTEEGGYSTVREAMQEGCDTAYFHLKGRSKRDVDVSSPWYPLHDCESEEEVYALLQVFESELNRLDAA